MLNIIKASLYKLFRDRTFIVTAIIGLFIAALLILIRVGTKSCTGEYFFVSASTPGSNYGITIPINLIVFTVGEFTYGTIRNKVIAGLSKTKIYVGLFITGLVFTFILIGGYSAILIAIGSIIGGFNAAAIGGVEFILPYLAYVVCEYIFITAISIFFSVLFRQIGGANTIVIVALIILSLIPLFTFIGASNNPSNMLRPDHWSMWLNPLYMLGLYGNDVVSIISKAVPGIDVWHQNEQMIASGILTPFIWAAAFFIGGLVIFKKKDIK